MAMFTHAGGSDGSAYPCDDVLLDRYSLYVCAIRDFHIRDTNIGTATNCNYKESVNYLFILLHDSGGRQPTNGNGNALILPNFDSLAIIIPMLGSVLLLKHVFFYRIDGRGIYCTVVRNFTLWYDDVGST